MADSPYRPPVGNPPGGPGVQSGRRAGVESPARTIPFEDAAVVRQVQSGDVQAYAQLVLKYQDRVHNTCCRLCGNVEDARDVTQDAFLKAFECIESFRGASSFYTWLFRIAVNLAINHRRRTARTRHASVNGDGEGSSAAASLADPAEPDPALRMARGEMRGHVSRALRELDETYRVAVVLRDMEGFDYAEIAEILGVPKGTVKSRIARGRLALREALLPYMGLDG